MKSAKGEYHVSEVGIDSILNKCPEFQKSPLNFLNSNNMVCIGSWPDGKYICVSEINWVAIDDA